MITVVIPTYKRIKALSRTLQSLSKQSHLPDEVYIIAAGVSQAELASVIQYDTLSITIIITEPSVCHQRNIGIRKVKTPYTLLCDDDIVLPKNYLETLLSYYNTNAAVRIATGEELRRNSNQCWQPFLDKISPLRLLYHYCFGLSVWDDLNTHKSTNFYLTKWVIKRYKDKGNGITKAGWPLLTHRTSSVFKTRIYSLQAALIPTTVLQQNLFDEGLGQYGIGDNYDVSLRINGVTHDIHVLTKIPYRHYKDPTNRMDHSKAYYLRTMALYNCMNKLSVFNQKNKWYFRWALFGNGIAFFIKGRFNYFNANLKVFKATLTQ